MFFFFFFRWTGSKSHEIPRPVDGSWIANDIFHQFRDTRYKIRVCIIYIRAYLTYINGDNQKFWLHPKCIIRNRWQSNEEREKNTSQRSPPIFKMWGTQLITIALNAYKMSVLSSSCYLFSYLAPPHSGCINCRSDISMGSSGNVGLKMVLYTKLAELHGEL